MSRAFLVVMDSVGIGGAPDADAPPSPRGVATYAPSHDTRSRLSESGMGTQFCSTA